MARIIPEKFDPDTPADSPDSVVRVDQVGLLETFDSAIRARFGRFISVPRTALSTWLAPCRSSTRWLGTLSAPSAIA